MHRGKTEPALYAQLMDNLKQQNIEYRQLLQSGIYQAGSVAVRLKNSLSRGDIGSMIRFAKSRRPGKDFALYEQTRLPERPAETPILPEEYFSDERIAVYSCLFGTGDHIQEPVCRPDNIDYYMITDQPLAPDSAWTPVEWQNLCDPSWTPAMKNRYFKMHPDVLFPSYRYSIYLDANIKVITDLTPYIFRTGDAGLGLHWHSRLDCVYDELTMVVAMKKLGAPDAERYRRYLEHQGMPAHYGLLEGNVIVREHHKESCRKIMDRWWEQFRRRVSRDQVSLPYVLWKAGISVDSVALLGGNVYENASLRVSRHISRNEE